MGRILSVVLSRRGFFAALAALAVAPRLRCVPAPPPTVGLAAIVAGLPPDGVVGGINQASFTFWRNQPQGLSFDALMYRDGHPRYARG